MQKKLNNIRAMLTTLFQEQAHFAILFGSVLTPYFRPDSDIDVAVYFKNPPKSFDEKVLLYEKVENLFSQKVDIVTLNNSDIIITMQILENGELIFNNDADFYCQFVARTLSTYPDFKRSRKVIEDMIMKVN